MTIGVLKLVLFIHNSNSLKDRRMALHSLKAKLRNCFNVAVAQIDDDDKWQKAALVVVGVGKDRKNMDRSLSNIVNFIERINSINLINYETELI